MKNNNKIIIAGKEFPCRITMGAMVRFKNESGYDFSEVKDNNLNDLILFLWCCVKSACSADEIPFEYSFQVFADCLEPEMMNSFYSTFDNSEKKTMK